MEQFTLSELQLKIKQSLYGSFPETVWLVAEINQLNENQNGHCYLELIEKYPRKGTPKAKAKATIWAYQYNLLKNYFENTTGSELQSGMQVLLRVSVEFHELYGLSLNVSDIDPAYTLGDIEKQRRQTIDALKNAGIFDMNKSTYLTVVPQRIAVISSEKAAGFDDFEDQLLNNEFGYQFELELFNADMQGKRTEKTVIEALDAIFERENEFDAVVIIRGGGSKSDLAAFDSFDIAANIAQFPLPVVTGIGHTRDESVCDMVAFAGLKTPTAVAEYFVNKTKDFDQVVTLAEQRLAIATKGLLAENKNAILLLQQKFSKVTHTGLAQHKQKPLMLEHALLTATRKVFENEKALLNKMASKQAVAGKFYLHKQRNILYNMQINLKTATEQCFNKQKHQLELLSQKVNANDPYRILEHGYSLTFNNGKILSNTEKLKLGDHIETHLKQGRISSTISQIHKT